MCSEGKRAAWLWWVLATSGGMISRLASAILFCFYSFHGDLGGRGGLQADFDKVTKFAHAVKKSLPPLKAAQV